MNTLEILVISENDTKCRAKLLTYTYKHTHRHTQSNPWAVGDQCGLTQAATDGSSLQGQRNRQHTTPPPTHRPGYPYTYITPQALHKSSATPPGTEKGERIHQILSIIKGIWGGCSVLRAAQKMLLYADDRWPSLQLWQSVLRICCNPVIHSHTCCARCLYRKSTYYSPTAMYKHVRYLQNVHHPV